MEKTFKFTQKAIRENVDINTQSKQWDLNLDTFGPYRIDYTSNGRFMMLAGEKGHIAMVDTQKQTIVSEINVKETIRDVHFLHSQAMYAVAQLKHTFIYDDTGMEIHCLRDHQHVTKMEYLKYHYLLTTINRGGILMYRDTSTGQLVATHRTKLGRCDCMRQNHSNAIINLGHANGTVTLWSPNMSIPLVKMLCHQGPVRSLGVDLTGHYMVTGGAENQMKVWDLRTYKEVHSYFTTSPAVTMAISERGHIAVGLNSHVQIWQNAIATKAKKPYMTHHMPGKKVGCVRFQPYEDVLGIGHSMGLATMIAPGTGEPNFDSFEANPFQTKKQRREQEIHNLLEKLKPDMIGLNSSVGMVTRLDPNNIPKEDTLEPMKYRDAKEEKERDRKRGKNKIGRKLKRKQRNVISEERQALKKQMQAANREEQKESERTRLPTSLQRFKVNRDDA